MEAEPNRKTRDIIQIILFFISSTIFGYLLHIYTNDPNYRSKSIEGSCDEMI
jgi:hypothetical protein